MSATKSSLHDAMLETFVPMLQSLAALLQKGVEHAQARGFDLSVLAQARLAPDMYPLVRQVQMACYFALDAAARLAAQQSPPMDELQTLEQATARLDATLDRLQNFPVAAFEGAADRPIKMALPNDLVLEMSAPQFLWRWVLPHFYFHLVTAYDLLRHNGVEIGKRDYLSTVGEFIHPKSKDQP
jgi:hypothetical protein